MKQQKETGLVKDSRQSRLFVVLLFLGFFAAACGTYLPALRSFFHSDDFVLLEAVRYKGAFGIWSDRESDFLRPLVSLSLYLDWRLWGLRPFGYHAANLFVHTLNALLVAALFPLLAKVIENKEDTVRIKRGAVFSGLLFLLHPIHPEAVTWVSGRTDLYATFFCLMAFVFYLCYRAGYGHLWQKGSLILFGLSLLCKEAAILFPLQITALEFFQARTAGRAIRSPKTVGTLWNCAWPFLAVVALYLLLRVCLLGKLVGGYGAVHTAFSPGQLFQSVLWFFCSAFLPLLPRWGYCFAALAFLGIVIFVRARQKATPGPVFGFLLAAFFLACAPVLNIGGGPAPNGMSGRLVYLASAFATVALVPLTDFLLPNARSAYAALTVLVGIFGIQLYALNLRWLTAGHIARQCIVELASAPPSRHIIVLTVPDTFHPAYILRNGLPEAMRLFYPQTVSKIAIVSSINLYDINDGVTIRSRKPFTETSRQVFDLVKEKPPKRIVEPGFTPYKMSGIEYQAKMVSEDRLQVIMTGTVDKSSRFYVFYKGKLRPLSSTSANADP